MLLGLEKTEEKCNINSYALMGWQVFSVYFESSYFFLTLCDILSIHECSNSIALCND